MRIGSGSGLTPNRHHWGRVTHICISKQTIIGSDNGLSPGWHQAIIWTNAGILLIGPLTTKFNEILIKIHTFSFKKIHLKMFVWKMAAILSPASMCEVTTLTNDNPVHWHIYYIYIYIFILELINKTINTAVTCTVKMWSTIIAGSVFFNSLTPGRFEQHFR